MKKLLHLILCLAVFATIPVVAQPAPEPLKAPPPTPKLSKFNLDFPGGTPGQLAAAIQKAMGRPLNVIIADEYATWKLPPLKMNQVDVAQLFRALELASQTRTIVPAANGSYSQTQTSYTFRESGPPTGDDTVWSFFVNGNMPMAKVSRFYHLKPYLDGGLTIDDITTAIELGWKMRGDSTKPALSFHKETKLLIAVGDFGGLDVIDQVLKALDPMKANPAVAAEKAAAGKTKS